MMRSVSPRPEASVEPHTAKSKCRVYSLQFTVTVYGVYSPVYSLQLQVQSKLPLPRKAGVTHKVG